VDDAFSWAAASARAICAVTCTARGAHMGPRFMIIAIVLAGDELHDLIGRAVGQGAEVRDVDDGPVANARGGARLLDEALEDLAVAGDVALQDLHRHDLLDDGVARLEDHAHAALAPDLEEAGSARRGWCRSGVRSSAWALAGWR